MKSILLQVKRPQDDDFLFELYQVNRQQEVSLWGWPEKDLRAFLVMQYRMQQQSYELRYAQAECFVIFYEDRKIGKFLITRNDKEWIIVDIAILPEYHNRGIGTFIIKQFVSDASQVDKSVRLSVLNGNPARRLYERLGFEVFQEDEVYCAMRTPRISHI